MKNRFATLGRFVLTAGMSLCCAVASHAALLVGFEDDEGFPAGSTAVTIGQWVISNTASISKAAAFEGEQSLRINGSTITQWNPTANQIGANYNLASFAVKADAFVANGSIGLWQALYGGAKTESRVELRLTFGATAEAPIKAEFLSTYSGAGAPTAFTTVYLEELNLLDWNVVSFGFNFTDQKYQIKIGDETVAFYEPLAAEVTSPRIARLFLRGNAATVSYYDSASLDHAEVIPEPSTALLLILPTLAWPLFRRKQRP